MKTCTAKTVKENENKIKDMVEAVFGIRPDRVSFSRPDFAEIGYLEIHLSSSHRDILLEKSPWETSFTSLELGLIDLLGNFSLTTLFPCISCGEGTTLYYGFPQRLSWWPETDNHFDDETSDSDSFLLCADCESDNYKKSQFEKKRSCPNCKKEFTLTKSTGYGVDFRTSLWAEGPQAPTDVSVMVTLPVHSLHCSPECVLEALATGVKELKSKISLFRLRSAQ